VATPATDGYEINGGDQDDELLGSSANDTLAGGAGDDTLDGGGGSDTVDYSAAKRADGTPLQATDTGVQVALRFQADDDTEEMAPGDTDAGTDELTSIQNIVGTFASDNLVGGANPNILTGGGGADTLDGRGDDDTLYADDLDSIDGGGGEDTAIFTAAVSVANIDDNDLVAVENVMVEGSFEFDFGSQTEALNITGDDADNTIIGGTANDTISGFGGDNQLQGGAGEDTLTGGLGANRYILNINLTTGESDSAPDAADNIMDFDKEKDLIEIRAQGINNFSGVEQNFFAFSPKGNPYEYRLALDDGDNTKEIAIDLPGVLDAKTAADLTRLKLTGTEAADTVAGGNAADEFVMLGGDDQITADDNDVIDGGDGLDTVIFQSAVDGSKLSDSDLINVEVVSLDGDLSAGVDLSAQTGSLTVIGDADNDTVIASSGGGSIRAKLGKDILTAGVAADTFIIHTVANVGVQEQLNESALASFDEVSNFDLANDQFHIVATEVSDFSVDQIIGGGSTALIPEGSAPNNNQVIWIDINANEKLIAGDGPNTEGGDVFVYLPGLTLTSEQAQAVVKLDLTGTDGDDSVFAGTLDDTLAGGAGNDTLSGGAGADSLTGGDGDDTFLYATGSDLRSNLASALVDATIVGGTGTDRISVADGLSVFDSVSFAKASSIEELYVTGTAASIISLDDTAQAAGIETINISASRNNGNVVDVSEYTTLGTTILGSTDNTNTLTGGGANDNITGGAGDDTITGGAGVDYLTGGAGADRFVQGANEGVAATNVAASVITFGNGADYVTDFSAAQGDILKGDGTALTSTAIQTTRAILPGTYLFRGDWSVASDTFTINGTGDDVMYATVTTNSTPEITGATDNAIILEGGFTGFAAAANFVA